MGQPLEWFDSISRTLRWNTRAAEQKSWNGQPRAGFGGAASHGDTDGADHLEEERLKLREPEFDIDFADGEEDGEVVNGSGSTEDSGYGGTGPHSEADVDGGRRMGWK